MKAWWQHRCSGRAVVMLATVPIVRAKLEQADINFKIFHHGEIKGY